MDSSTNDKDFREPRLLYVLFLVFAMGMGVLIGVGLSGGAKYGWLAATVVFAIWPVMNILHPRRFAGMRDGNFEIVNTETWKTDVFPIGKLQRVSLEQVVVADKNAEGGWNSRKKLTLHLLDGTSTHYLLPYRDSVCEEVARELRMRLSASSAAI